MSRSPYMEIRCLMSRVQAVKLMKLIPFPSSQSADMMDSDVDMSDEGAVAYEASPSAFHTRLSSSASSDYSSDTSSRMSRQSCIPPGVHVINCSAISCLRPLSSIISPFPRHTPSHCTPLFDPQFPTPKVSCDVPKGAVLFSV